VVDAMRGSTVRVWLGDTLEERARSADSIADAVMARLGATAVAGGPSSSPPWGIGRPPTSARRRPSSRALATGAVFASALAIAAAVAMVVRGGGRAPLAKSAAPSGEATAPERMAATPAGTESGSAPRGVEVEEIDSASHVSIFEISALANASGPSSVVVWIDDDPGEK
jgi:hypothetical protein